MPINRFDRIVKNDYSWQTYVPKEPTINIEAWDKLMTGIQDKYNTTKTLSDKLPNYYKDDVNLFNEYKSKTETATNAITDAYMNQGFTAGQRALNQHAAELKKDWQQGGIAHTLEAKYTKAAEISKELDKYYKEKGWANTPNAIVAQSKLKENLATAVVKKGVSGNYEYANIDAPVLPYVDVVEEASKVLKDIKDSGTTTIIPYDQMMFQKIKTEGVNGETIKYVTDQLFKQPKFQQQLQIEHQANQLTKPLDPEATKQKVFTDLDNQYTKALAGVDAAFKSKDKKQLIKELDDQGIDTKDLAKAKVQYTEKLLAQKEQQKKDFNVEQFDYQNRVIEPYKNTLASVFTRKKIDIDLETNQLAKIKYEQSKADNRQAKMISTMQELMVPEGGGNLITPGKTSKLDFQKYKTETFATADAMDKNLNSVLSTTGIITKAGGKSNAAVLADISKRSSNFQDFQNQVNEYNKNNAKAPISVPDLKGSFDIFKGPSGHVVDQAFQAQIKAQQAKDLVYNAENSRIKGLLDDPSVKADVDDVRSRYKLTGRSDEDVLNIILSGDKMFNYTKPGSTGGRDGGGTAANYSNELREKWNKLPVAKQQFDPQETLPGFTLTSNTKYGKQYQNLIEEDIKNHRTEGYLTDGVEGISFKDENGKVYKYEDLAAGSFSSSLHVDDKVNYIMTGTVNTGTGDKQKALRVTAYVTPPESHRPNQEMLAAQLQADAINQSNPVLKTSANQLYSITKNPGLGFSVAANRLELDDKNTYKLDNIIDPTNSGTNIDGSPRLSNLAERSGLKGRFVETFNAGGKDYKVYKTMDKNRSDKNAQFIVTTEADNGREVALPSPNGSIFYNRHEDIKYGYDGAELQSTLPVKTTTQKLSGGEVLSPQQALNFLSTNVEGNN